jgi:hypothetical protein
MTSKIKGGGLGGIAAGLLFLLSAIINQVSPIQRVYDSAADYTYLAANIAGYVGVIVALIGIHALHTGRPRYGRLGVAGTVITIVGYAIIAILTMISMVRGAASLINVRLGGGVAVLIGSALLGVVILRARLLPWWCGVLLIVAFPLGAVANAIFISAENLLLALLWGSVGVGLLARRQGAAEAAATHPA